MTLEHDTVILGAIPPRTSKGTDTMSIHHATTARATKLGATIQANADGTFMLLRNEDSWVSSDYPSARIAVQALADGQVEFTDPSASNFRMTSGVMVISYHQLYTANGGGCGDNLDITLRALLMPDGEAVDLELLRKVADTNGVWAPRWASLNPGMQRMNMANRLRGILRNDADAKVDLLGEVGRFGVPYRPSAKAIKAKARASKLMAAAAAA
ncbi:MAG: hypothetical protein V4583_16370 [Pseudomonadota bacterium]